MTRLRSHLLSGLIVAVVTVVTGCSLLDRPPPPAETSVVVAQASAPASLGPRADGSFLYGERQTGRVLSVGADGNVGTDPVATVGVAAGAANGGLVGVATDDVGRTFVLATRADARLVVLQVAPDGERTVWEGPEVTGEHLGGTLVARDGRLVFAVGDLGDPDAVQEVSTPNGKLLGVLPDGPPAQQPTVLGSGFVDPAGLTVGPFGDWWVADRAGADQPPRVIRVRPGGELEATALDGGLVPAALVALGDTTLGLCVAGDATVRRVDVVDGYATAPTDVVAEGCALAAARRADGTVLITTTTEIRSFRP